MNKIIIFKVNHPYCMHCISELHVWTHLPFLPQQSGSLATLLNCSNRSLFRKYKHITLILQQVLSVRILRCTSWALCKFLIEVSATCSLYTCEGLQATMCWLVMPESPEVLLDKKFRMCSLNWTIKIVSNFVSTEDIIDIISQNVKENMLYIASRCMGKTKHWISNLKASVSWCIHKMIKRNLLTCNQRYVYLP